jgi:lipid II:glycine glycyltransferase (peptidoglycan interpeptide bridge formation enzyme)
MMNNQRFLQTPFWAEFKGAHGWKPYYFDINQDGSISKAILTTDSLYQNCPSTPNQFKQPTSSSKKEDEIRTTTNDHLCQPTENTIKTAQSEVDVSQISLKDDKAQSSGQTPDVIGRQKQINQAVNNIHTSSLGNTRLTVLVRSFTFLAKKFSIAYVPMAPESISTPVASQEYLGYLQTLSQQLKQFIPSDSLCVRFDPPIDFLTVDERDEFVNNIPTVCKKNAISVLVSPTAVQPPDTVLLSLDKTEDQILANMKSKWRYNIHLAEKKEVTVTPYHAGDEGFESAFDAFYNLFETTGKRDGISPHAKSYYRDLLERGKPTGDCSKPVVTLYIATNENDNLAGIITLFCNREAVYLYGASGNIKRNLMPAYLLQWSAIKDAKAFGCPVYDFYGMPPTDDPTHPMHGLYLFKTGFGGTIIHRPGSFDVPLSKSYSLYIKAEKFRAWYHRKFIKKIIGR